MEIDKYAKWLKIDQNVKIGTFHYNVFEKLVQDIFKRWDKMSIKNY